MMFRRWFLGRLRRGDNLSSPFCNWGILAVYVYMKYERTTDGCMDVRRIGSILDIWSQMAKLSSNLALYGMAFFSLSFSFLVSLFFFFSNGGFPFLVCMYLDFSSR
jgi:hypothetical protein